MSIKDFEALNPHLFNKLPDKRADDSTVHAPLDDFKLWLPDPATHKLTDVEIEQLELEAVADAYIGDYSHEVNVRLCECGADSVGGGRHSSWCPLA